nr:adult-specific rigid cuticular protein 15.5-like [Parasteatoda tepidariorum]
MSTHFRSEVGDGSGMVRGSYGYQDAQGLRRQVDYVAGPGIGFQANVKTNEPGTIGHQKEQPSHVVMQAQPPPPGVQTHFGSSLQSMKMMAGGMEGMKMMEGGVKMMGGSTKMMGGGMMGGGYGMVGGGKYFK